MAEQNRIGREGGREGGEASKCLHSTPTGEEHNMTRNEVLYNYSEILVLKALSTYSAFVPISHHTSAQHQHDALIYISNNWSNIGK